MSFGLKNTSVTYQRAIQCCLKDQIRKNVEAYVDDVVINLRLPTPSSLTTPKFSKP
jgi:hypothetical protein